MLSDTINSTVQIIIPWAVWKVFNLGTKMKGSFDSDQLEIRRIKHVCKLYQLALDKMWLFSSAGSRQNNGRYGSYFRAFFDSSCADRGHINTLATFVLFSLKRIRERFLFKQ